MDVYTYNKCMCAIHNTRTGMTEQAWVCTCLYVHACAHACAGQSTTFGIVLHYMSSALFFKIESLTGTWTLQLG